MSRAYVPGTNFTTHSFDKHLDKPLTDSHAQISDIISITREKSVCSIRVLFCAVHEAIPGQRVTTKMAIIIIILKRKQFKKLIYERLIIITIFLKCSVNKVKNISNQSNGGSVCVVRKRSCNCRYVDLKCATLVIVVQSPMFHRTTYFVIRLPLIYAQLKYS